MAKKRVRGLTLESTIQEKKTEHVDYEYIREVFLSYQQFLQEPSDANQESLASKVIPLSNVFLARAYKRFPFMTERFVRDDLYSWIYFTMLNDLCTRRVEFENEKRMFAYFNIRLVMGVQTYYMYTHVRRPNSEADNAEYYAGVSHQPAHDHINDVIASVRFQQHLNWFLQRYPPDEGKILQELTVHILQSPETISSFTMANAMKFFRRYAREYTRREVERFLQQVLITIRTSLFVCMRDDIVTYSPTRSTTVKGKTIMDKGYLLLVLLERSHPGMVELYHILGEKVYDVILTHGGKKMSLPKAGELEDLERRVNVFLYQLQNPDVPPQQVAERFGLATAEVTSINNTYRSIFERVPAIREVLFSSKIQVTNE